MKKTLFGSAMLMGLVSLGGCDSDKKVEITVPEQKVEMTLPKDEVKVEGEAVKVEGEAATLFGMGDIRAGIAKANNAAKVLDKAAAAAGAVVKDAAKGSSLEAGWNKAAGMISSTEEKVRNRIEESASDTAKNIGYSMGTKSSMLMPERYKSDVIEGAIEASKDKTARLESALQTTLGEKAARDSARKPLPPTPGQ